MIDLLKPPSWHRDRQKGLGGTDTASILGVGYHSAIDVYESKTASEPIVSTPSERMLHGLFNEAYIAAKYSEMAGVELELCPDIIFHPTQTFRLCSPDRRAKLPKKRRKMIEFKSVYSAPGAEWGEVGSDDVPDGFLIQVQHDLDVALAAGEVTEETADLCVNFVGYETRIYTIDLRETLMRKVVSIERDFWKNVEEKLPVTEWKHPLSKEVKAEIAFSRPGTIKRLGDESLEYAKMMDDSAAMKKEAAQLRNNGKLGFVKLLAGIETGILPDGRRVTQKIVNRKGYTCVVAPTEYLDVRIKKGKASDVDNEDGDEA